MGGTYRGIQVPGVDKVIPVMYTAPSGHQWHIYQRMRKRRVIELTICLQAEEGQVQRQGYAPSVCIVK